MSTVAYASVNYNDLSVLGKHNQDDIINIARLSKSFGAKRITYIESNRFENGGKSEFVNNGVQQVLEKTTLDRALLDVICNKNIPLTNVAIGELEQMLHAK